MITGETSREVAERDTKVAILAVGSFAQHGEHLPLATDTLVAEVIAERLAAEYDLFRLPPLTMSCSHEHVDFPGTVSLSASTLVTIIDDIRTSLAETLENTRLVLVNGNTGNHVLANIAQEANTAGATLAVFPTEHDVDKARKAARMESTTPEDPHGGEWETSILLHAYPDLVRPGYTEADFDAPERPHFHLTGMTGYSKSGIIGHPSKATAEKGHKALDCLTQSFNAVLDILND
ncbi:creatininase family protein [Actinokineospora auranticolor]|uniref:Creatinine amidohydrolase n=1 Tax=Actinokineospora auranticolor TaxID=155976 RepID=A0A2S6GP83_9PSEU|nr:creatininase family protein [Actinokineospora auranticolor]PPK67029.1 creatinine amidohydrolase [Actinokineospora auranticolor]